MANQHTKITRESLARAAANRQWDLTPRISGKLRAAYYRGHLDGQLCEANRRRKGRI